jgi:uncharacterized RDD family membrane protein YckC
MAEADLAIRPVEEPETELADLELQPKRRELARRAPKTLGLIHPAREVEVDVPISAPEPLPAPLSSPETPTELPLFVKGIRADLDELTVATLTQPPRAPLAVRRALPDPPRPKLVPNTPPRRPGPIESDFLEDLSRAEAEEQIRYRAEAKAQARREREATGEADARTRLAALATDWGVLGTISLLVLWSSLRVAGTGLGSLGFSALAPLAAFLALVHFAYFFVFTAGNGQTPGKMAFSLRVVDATAPDIAGRPPSARQTAGRVLLAAMSSLLFGLGFLPSLIGRGLSLHDRVSQTRIVRA